MTPAVAWFESNVKCLGVYENKKQTWLFKNKQELKTVLFDLWNQIT